MMQLWPECCNSLANWRHSLSVLKLSRLNRDIGTPSASAITFIIPSLKLTWNRDILNSYMHAPGILFEVSRIPSAWWQTNHRFPKNLYIGPSIKDRLCHPNRTTCPRSLNSGVGDLTQILEAFRPKKKKKPARTLNVWNKLMCHLAHASRQMRPSYEIVVAYKMKSRFLSPINH